ncbi:MAG: hypothetical protein AB8C84_09485 [Oligoflexales bacterium]
MKQKSRRMILPGWWWECWRHAWDQKSEYMPAVTPRFDVDELQLLALLLNDLRSVILSGSQSWCLSVEDALKLCPGVKRLQKKMERVLEALGGLRLLNTQGVAKPFFTHESWDFSVLDAQVTFEVADHILPWVVGFEFYAGRPQHSWCQKTFSVLNSAFIDMTAKDLDLYLRMEKAMQDGEHRVHADHVHGIAICPQDWVSAGGRHRLSAFMRRLKDHGVLTNLGETPVNAYEEGSLIYWKEANTERREEFYEAYVSDVSKVFVKLYQKYLNKNAFDVSDQDVFVARLQSGYIISLNWLAQEWKYRLTHKDLLLPVALQTTVAGQILKNSDDHFDEFCNEVLDNSFYHFWIDIDLMSSARVIDAFSESDFKNEKSNLGTKSEKRYEFANTRPKHIERVEETGKTLEKASDLVEMKRVKPLNYNLLKRKFFDSLNRTEKEALLNGSQKMEETEFDQYLQRLLAVFAEKNPKIHLNSTQTH